MSIQICLYLYLFNQQTIQLTYSRSHFNGPRTATMRPKIKEIFATATANVAVAAVVVVFS